MLLEPNRCFTSPPEVRRPRRQLFFWISRACVLQCLGSWAIKNVVFSRVWGVMAPMGKLVTCLVPERPALAADRASWTPPEHVFYSV